MRGCKGGWDRVSASLVFSGQSVIDQILPFIQVRRIKATLKDIRALLNTNCQVGIL